MSTEILDFTATNADLPPAVDLKSYLIANANVATWAQADAAHVSESGGRVVTFNDLKDGAALYTQSTGAANQAILEAATISDYSSAFFDGVDRAYPWVKPNPDFSGEWGVAALLNSDVITGNRFIWTRASNQTTMAVIGNDLACIHRGVTLTPDANITTGTWYLLLMSGNGTTFRAAVNGLAATTSAAATGTLSTSVPLLGAQSFAGGVAANEFVGNIADVWTFNIDILNSADSTAADLRAQVLQYCRGTYSLTL